MFPFSADRYKYTELLPPVLPEPVELEFTFIGGPFDGHKNTGIAKRELTDGVTVVMKKESRRYQYRYAGNNTWQFEKEVEPIKFMPVYKKGKIDGTKVYAAGLTDLQKARPARQGPFKTASGALQYAQRWAERVNRWLVLS